MNYLALNIESENSDINVRNFNNAYLFKMHLLQKDVFTLVSVSVKRKYNSQMIVWELYWLCMYVHAIPANWLIGIAQ